MRRHSFDGGLRNDIHPKSQAAFGAWEQALNAVVPLAGSIDSPGEGLEKGLDHMVWFVSIKQLQVKVAPGFICESLKEFPRQTEPKRARHVLRLLRPRDSFASQLIHPPPHQERAAAKID